MSPATRLILIEGLPGCGKTSLAEWLHDRLNHSGQPTEWCREEARDHPVIGKMTRMRGKTTGYLELCADRWADFADSGHDSLWVLEGCLFQSTVRFSLEYEDPQADPLHYLQRTEAALKPLNPVFIRLTVDDPARYLRDEFPSRKDADTISRIAAYSSRTPWAQTRGLTGFDALTGLYTAYSQVCDGLAQNTSMPLLTMDVQQNREADVRAAVWQWLGMNSTPKSAKPASDLN